MNYWNMSEVDSLHLAQWTRNHFLHPACWNILLPLTCGLFLPRWVLYDGNFWLFYWNPLGWGRTIFFHYSFSYMPGCRQTQWVLALFLWCCPSSTFISFFISSFRWIWHFHRVWMAGATAGLWTIWHLPRKYPMQSNCFGYASLRLLMPHIGLAVFLISQYSIIIFSFWQFGNPSIAGSFVSAIKTFPLTLVISTVETDCTNLTSSLLFSGGFGQICLYIQSGNI